MHAHLNFNTNTIKNNLFLRTTSYTITALNFLAKQNYYSKARAHELFLKKEYLRFLNLKMEESSVA